MYTLQYYAICRCKYTRRYVLDNKDDNDDDDDKTMIVRNVGLVTHIYIQQL